MLRAFIMLSAAVLVAVGFNVFGYQAFHVPSASMKPTLLIGDTLLASKLAYGSAFRRCRLAWCPETPPFGGLPQRGDVIVFEDRVHGGYAVKRVIGLPGDEVKLISGEVVLNGQRLGRRDAGQFAEVYERRGHPADFPLCAAVSPREGDLCLKRRQTETAPDGTEYDTLDIGLTTADFMGPHHVPAGQYFVMGDNRDNSTDSRVAASDGGIGYVPLDAIVGRVGLVLFSSPTETPWAFWTLRGDRFFMRL